MFDTFTQKFPRDYTAAYTIMEELVLENEYEIAVPLFGAAFAAPNKGTTILY